ncbi:hypothetical protein JCM19238_351 [Vibrio ponticus]|nr:hypothetical protein JCM19238_351 [Vibrio ponticus]
MQDWKQLREAYKQAYLDSKYRWLSGVRLISWIISAPENKLRSKT